MRSLVLILSLLAAPAFGLTCKPRNFGEDFNRIAVVEEIYSVGYGQLREVDPIPDAVEGQPRSVRMRFVGKMLGGSGFGQTGSVDITVNMECAGSFCGPVPTTRTPMIAFLEHKDDGLALKSGVCAPDYLLSPTLGQLSAVRACMRLGACGEEELDAFEIR